MPERNEQTEHAKTAYRARAVSYDRAVERFDAFAWMGFDLTAWRRGAIDALGLNPGDTVVDIGCGTGAALADLRQAVGENGRVIGVDLSTEMIDEAQKLVAANGWQNVELVCADAADIAYPARVDAIHSAFAFILMPKADRVADAAIAALKPDGRMAIVDMTWPDYLPLWFRHVLAFLRSYGVTKATLERRAWVDVQKAMAERLADFALGDYWFRFFYLATGTKPAA